MFRQLPGLRQCPGPINSAYCPEASVSALGLRMPLSLVAHLCSPAYSPFSISSFASCYCYTLHPSFLLSFQEALA